MTMIKFKNRENYLGGVCRPAFQDIFENLLKSETADKNYIESAWMPAANISENAEGYVIELTASGMKKSDLKIAFEKSILTISGERKNDRGTSNSEFTRREFSYGKFSRSFNLPVTADSEKIKAEFIDGLLTLSIPKKEEAKEKPGREINIS